MIVHSYARFSDPSQEGGDSLRRQRDAAEAFCKRKGWKLSDLKFVDKGKSGFKGDKQKALKSFCAAVDEGIVRPGETLLVEAIDRLSRKGPRATRNTIESLLDAGINIAILSPMERIYKASENNDTMMFAIEIAAFAEQAQAYSQNLSKRVKAFNANRRQKFAKGEAKRISAKPPSWLRLSLIHI